MVRTPAIVGGLVRARRRLPELLDQADPQVRPLLAGLSKTLSLRASPEERAWIRQIEKLRRELGSSPEPVTRLLYPGRPDGSDAASTPAPDEGHLVTRPLGDWCHSVSRPPFWCRVLFNLVRELRPTSCLELGSGFGLTTMYQAAGLALNGEGRLTSLEGDPAAAELAAANTERLGLLNVNVVIGKFDDTLPAVLSEQAPLDFVFYDADKRDGQMALYLERVFPHLSARATIVVDDIYWSESMQRSWQTISADHRVKVVIDLHGYGICLLDPTLTGRQELALRIG